MFRYTRLIPKFYGCMLAVLPVTLYGCISDDSNCRPSGTTALRFTYTLNEEGTDRFAEDVEHLELFFFDENDRFVRKSTLETIPVNLIDTDLSPGTYTVVAWGNTHTGHFRFREKERPAHIGELELSVAADQNILSGSLPLLFHGKETFTVGETDNTVVAVQLTRNTKVVRVIISGLKGTYKSLEELNLDMDISGCNGRYDSNNMPVEDMQTVSYRPAPDPLVRDNGEMLFTIHTLRILEGSDLRMRIREIHSGNKFLVDEELLSLLVRGEEIEDLSDYLLRTHEFNIIGIELEQTESGYVVSEITLGHWDEISEEWEVVVPPGEI